jgi:hypothetical protein
LLQAQVLVLLQVLPQHLLQAQVLVLLQVLPQDLLQAQVPAQDLVLL